jgi:hypothetical protein
MANLAEIVPTEWTVTDVSTGNADEISCTRTGESGKSHYITHIALSADNSSFGANPNKFYLKHGSGSTLIFEAWAVSNSTARGGPISFFYPLRIPAGDTVTLSSTQTSSNQVAATLTGYTR